MEFKKMDHSLKFGEMALANSMEANRRLKLMEKLKAILDWPSVDAVLKQN